MSHAAAEACTQRLAAGHGDGYRLAALDDRSNGEAASYYFKGAVLKVPLSPNQRNAVCK